MPNLTNQEFELLASQALLFRRHYENETPFSNGVKLCLMGSGHWRLMEYLIDHWVFEGTDYPSVDKIIYWFDLPKVV